MIIKYQERRVTDISIDSTANAKVLFEYYSDYTSTATIALIALIILICLAFIVGCSRIYYFTKRNPR